MGKGMKVFLWIVSIWLTLTLIVLIPGMNFNDMFDISSNGIIGLMVILSWWGLARQYKKIPNS